jgi:hypothetical protein
MQRELELDDDPEVAPSAAQGPEQVGMRVGTGMHLLTGGGDHVERDHVVAGEPVSPGEPTHAAAQGETPDPRVRHVPRRRRQSVLL